METALKRSRDLLILGLVAAVFYLLGRDASPGPAYGYRDVDHNRDMIAVTGQYGTGTSVLYLVDTRRKSLLVYEARGGTQSDLKLVAIRDITYDLEVRSYNDVTDSAMKVEALERQWRQFSGKGSRTGKAARGNKPQDTKKSPPGKSPGDSGLKKK